MSIVNRNALKKIAVIIIFILISTTIVLLGTQYKQFLKIKSDQIDKLNANSIVVDTNQGTIEYSISGKGDPVLMIHGAGGGYDQGLMLADAFLPKDCMVIAVSRFGYLNTPLPGGSTTDCQAGLYRALLDELDINKVHVVAVSDGGPSALKFSINHPERVRSLTMICAKSKTPPKLTTVQSVVFGTIFHNDFLFWIVTEYIQSDLLNVLGVSKEVQDKMTEDEIRMAKEFFEIMNPISLRKQGIFDANIQFKELLPEDYPIWEIKSPTLVIHAEDDTLQPFYYAEYTHEKIPNSTLLSFEDGGHMFFGHHEEITKAIKHFFVSAY
ncbi:alpha/beta fold hydrolase [Serpentinicella alkaliphila]|uniref:Pimeloyl-ACP methyl ester carboxylesterase n=1 Tax=Serpentinicella alkaliphila TaxID=1734049 RepID=A0A4R2TTD2_9FIRM|nr:alpha/beta hydrolase [Serpentinicella alkaliphila]QUH25222.1 alpha/beta hydrolase [Serpentinicella alkaliphila]TCQ07031.1 pimeloyl-ACP methyl ester carboxylesterase [Serpentinicella alkaliphila]